jgi:hypothetical protein
VVQNIQTFHKRKVLGQEKQLQQLAALLFLD